MEGRSLRRLNAILTPLADLLLTPLCFGCGSRLREASDLICEDCLAQLALPGEDTCKLCGTQLEQGACPHCAESIPLFRVARSAFLFKSPVRELVHAFKYDSYTRVSPWLIKGMLQTYQSEPAFSCCDLVTAVPLHWVRQRDRGFNQSELLARQLAKHLGLAYKQLARRSHHTPSQTRLSKEERQHNLGNAFKLKSKQDLSGSHILLIDDVFTTGTTVNQLSRLFLDHQAASVAVLTAARAI